MNNLQASYYEDENKIVDLAAQEKNQKNDFSIDTAAIIMVTEDTKSTEDEPQTLNRAWNHPYLESQRKWQEAVQKEFSNRKK